MMDPAVNACQGVRLFTAYGVSELVNDAVLNLRFGIYSLNSRGESRQVIRAGNENVLYTTIP